jgi:Na+-transporting methylmalonyl-CoA/oxaloacetate decarboxylase beta subunit
VRHGTGYRVLVRLLEGRPSADEAIAVDGGADGAAAIFVARELGQDLADAFGDKDVFVLQ